MKFKELRKYINCEVVISLGYSKIDPTNVDNVSHKYDNYEVVCIYAQHKKSIVFEDYIVINLKEPLFDDDTFNENTIKTKEKESVIYQADKNLV